MSEAGYELIDETANKYLVFYIDELFALELKSVIEIIDMRPITKVPETPEYIAGVMNLRGEALPVIDMRARFKKAPKGGNDRQCMIVARFDDMKLALLVDEVTDLVGIDPDNVNPPPQVGHDYSHVFIKAIGVREEGMLLIVDTDKLVNLSELDFMSEENE
jgi:Chemotaxis signal transduction protein